MKKLIFISFFLLSILTNAQNRVENVNIGPKFKTLFIEFENCVDAKKENCIALLNNIIKKGKSENVPFLDYLYFKKAYYFWNRKEVDSTIFYSQLAIKNPNPTVKERSDLEAHNLLGSAYYLKGDLHSAIENFLKVANILEDGGNPIHLGYLYSNIATLLGETKNDDKQLEYLQKSYHLLKENNDKRFIATVASNIGLLYYHVKDTLNTVKWSEKALELAKSSTDLIALTQSNLTLSLIEKNLNKSEQYAKLSVKYAEELNDKSHTARAYTTYADALEKLGKSTQALKYAENAVKLTQEIGDKNNLIRASKTAGTISYNLDQKEKAAEFFFTYAIWKDSISSVEKTREINEIHAKYETEKKEKQIVEQELKIQKQRSNFLYAVMGSLFLISILSGIFIYNRSEQKSKLKQLQQEKENSILNSFILGEERERRRISQELHDGVAAMIGAAKMSLESIPHLSDEKKLEQLSKVKNILDDTHSDVRHIAHNLMPTVLEKEGLIKATSHFASEINETKLVKITVTDKSSNIEMLSPQLQLMLFRVIQELVNNIIKHSQAQNAEIAFSNGENGLQIEISDDGIGYEGNNSTGNQGLYTINQRLKSIGGNFKITKKQSGGTQAKVVMSL
ncbi:tetratricopeptide repeat-containing sensor histidine kinase [Aequorivita sinensis]|uniref:tetratricopeptide repeat-containing sensor histidine kinase n=1 Tax=Aequorivita sinensis TaxID=1382458 RepID=UPI0022FFCC99|nr:sensor histidine kinase [Aequorivita sinensis]